MLHMGQYRKVGVKGVEWPLNRCGSAAGVLWTIQALIGVRRAEGVDGDRSRERYSGLHHETRGSWTGNLKAISGRWSWNFHLTLSLGMKLFTILLSQELQLSVMEKSTADSGKGERLWGSHLSSRPNPRIWRMYFSSDTMLCCYTQGPEASSTWVGLWQLCVIIVHLWYQFKMFISLALF